MPSYVALLRAVNVGGTTMVMQELAARCRQLGFGEVRTYIQSGNVVLHSPHGEEHVRSMIEKELAGWMGKPIEVFVRDGGELRALVEANPFPGEPPTKVVVLFCAAPVSPSIAEVTSPTGETLVVHGRDIFVHYPDGQGRSKLRLPKTLVCTARNLNTVTKLAALADAAR